MPRIISWNTQGNCMSKLNTHSSALLSSSSKNIIMIQEGGADKNDGDLFDHTLKGKDFKCSFFDQPGAINQRCSTGILVEGGITFNDTDKIFKFKGMGKRPIVTCDCTCKDKNGISQRYIFATVHLTALDDTAREELLETYQAFEYNFSHSVNWLIIGDMNCDAREVKELFPRNIAYPSSDTYQSGGILDFAVFSDLMRGKIKVDLCTDRKGDVPVSSDHFPVYCEF